MGGGAKSSSASGFQGFLGTSFHCGTTVLGENKKFAFTLAEVLITLSIIGVVAAMTLPELINKTNNKENLTALKKAYSILSQATIMVNMDNPTNYWDTSGQATEIKNIQQIYNLYKPYLKIVKDCGCAVQAKGCWSKDATKTLNGKVYQYGHAEGIGHTYCAARLADGMNISFDTWGKNDLSVASKSNSVFFFYVDVNGDKKPNTFGKDVFQFVVLNDKGTLVPAGYGTDSPKCTKQDNSNNAGIDCANKVLTEEKFDF